MLTISGPRMEAYARRCGADFVVLTENPYPNHPVTAKWGVGRALDHYERVAFLDADTLVSAEAPNLFDLVPCGCFAVFNELPQLLSRWIQAIENYQAHRQTQKRPRVPINEFYNSGVYVCDRGHAKCLAAPEHPCLPDHCFEQDNLNMLLADYGVPVFDLPETTNYQWWIHGGFDDAPSDAILHFAGLYHSHEVRMREMRRFDAILPRITVDDYLQSFLTRQQRKDGCAMPPREKRLQIAQDLWPAKLPPLGSTWDIWRIRSVECLKSIRTRQDAAWLEGHGFARHLVTLGDLAAAALENGFFEANSGESSVQNYRRWKASGLPLFAGDERPAMAEQSGGLTILDGTGRLLPYTALILDGAKFQPFEVYVAHNRLLSTEAEPDRCDFADLYAEVVASLPQDGGVVVEVGSFLGSSAIVMARLIKASGKKVRFVCVDHFKGSCYPHHQNLAKQRGGSLRADFAANLAAAGVRDLAEIIEGDSAASAALFADASCDFVFIDADHDYESVKSDITAWLPKVRGVLAGHDWNWPSVARAVGELLPNAKPDGACWIWPRSLDREVKRAAVDQLADSC
jgi:hypothetical protein